MTGPRCAECVRNYPDCAEHESCAEVQIAAESVPWGPLPPLRDDTGSTT